MRGFVANTDFDWYSFLSQQPDLAEVNFWAPSGKAQLRAIEIGEPFFFRLKKPYYAIAGFGFYVHASTVPLSLAWEAFGIANGASTPEEMVAQVEKYRSGAAGAGVRDPEVGCRMIVDPIFFPEPEWVREPADWQRQTVVGKTYDLAVGEGQRIWEECLDRRLRLQPPAADGAVIAGERSTLSLVERRLGQGSFRIAVSDAYARSCAVTGEKSLPVLEAAHIRPYAKGGAHQVINGLLLRSDIHRLFDRGYVTVDPDYRFVVSEQLREDWHNGRVYYEHDGRRIHLPGTEHQWPTRELLEWHASTVFLG